MGLILKALPRINTSSMARMPNTIVVIVINIFSKIEKLKSLESNPVDVSDRTIGLSPIK